MSANGSSELEVSILRRIDELQKNAFSRLKIKAKIN